MEKKTIRCNMNMDIKFKYDQMFVGQEILSVLALLQPRHARTHAERTTESSCEKNATKRE